jgi:alkylation response protein AidB-like acyl-CoA dehydrogenase
MIFGDEVSVYELPTKPLTVGLGMCGPTILAHGTNEQKTRYLRPLLRAEEIWSQLFSEPEAGSDLASVRSFAKRNGADWRLNGQKVWISGAQYADFGLLLCRTDQSSVPHSGLSMFILNMRAPGVLVRPLRQMTGHAKFSEVFFDDVAIPDSNRVGQVGEGWRCLITTLMAERLTISQARDAARCGSSTQLIEIARAREVAEDPRVRDMIVTVWTQERTLQLLRDRKNAALRSDREPGPEGSLAKMGFSKLVTDASNGGVGLTGPGALAWSPDDSFGEDWAERLCLAQGLKIGGGTLEIQKNTIGERVLGLPKEP